MLHKLRKNVHDLRIAFLHGKAFKKIEKGNYAYAASLLERLCEEDPEGKNEYSYFCIGDCYYRLEKYEKAQKWLKKSFDIYKMNILRVKNPRVLRTFSELKKTYIEVLRINGQHEVAKMIKSKYKVRS